MKIGDLVVLRQGGPVMFLVDDDPITCEWVEKGHYVSKQLDRVELMTLTNWMVLYLEGSNMVRTK